MSPIGTFLSEETMGKMNWEGGNDHAIKRSMGKQYCLPGKEVILEI